MHSPVRIEITPIDRNLGPQSRASRSRIVLLDRNPGAAQLNALCAALTDVVEIFRWEPASGTGGAAPVTFVEVGRLPGVTDAEARAVEAVAAQLGIDLRAATATRSYRAGATAAELAALGGELANANVDRFAVGPLAPAFEEALADGTQVAVVPVRNKSAEELAELSRAGLLSLDSAELEAVATFFQAEGRDPTEAELETIAQTWSEHCSHKTFRATIELEENGEIRVVEGLLRLLRDATDELAAPWVRSAFVDNAGIVAFAPGWDLAIKVETHNHPSALEPFGGANTGIGGVVRDVIGVSARPIACVDVLCFGLPDTAPELLPAGALHPARIAEGVVAGIGDYGNKLGLPTLAGAVLYHPGYVGNPLVFCGAVGLLPTGSHPTSPAVQDRVVVIGGRTGRDGIHGATFSSADLAPDTASIATSAVQIGDPITEKQLIELVEAARDAQLYSAITDCGAGGLSSAVGEIAERTGVAVDIAPVPRKYPGLQPWEVWVSESQERMVLTVPPVHLANFRALCEHWSVECTDLGAITDSGRLVVTHAGSPVIDLPMAFLHDGRPSRRMAAIWADTVATAAAQPPESDPAADLLALLADPTIASKEAIFRTFDHEVRGGTRVRPWCGPGGDGPTDAAVFVPLGLEAAGPAVVLAVGVNPRYAADPYLMALAAIDEAFRNLVSVGGDPDQVALLDNFCWGNPTLADRLGGLVRAVEGCRDGAMRYRAPFVSGKDSLFNEYDGQAIPGTILITALGRVPEATRAITSAPGERQTLYLVGDTEDELGGSMWAEHHGFSGGVLPAPLSNPLPRYRAVHNAIAAGFVAAAHDCSEGGLAVALGEMAIAGRVGIDVALPEATFDAVPAAAALFGESNGRLVLAAAPGRERELELALAGIPLILLGATTATGEGLRIGAFLDVPLPSLVRAWGQQ